MNIKNILRTNNLSSIIFIRLLVGSVFLSEGIQKFLYSDALGIGRFIKIGIPAPEFFAPFVGTVEVVFGFLIIIGLLTRIAAIYYLVFLRRDRDSNPGRTYILNGFQDRRIQPLCHLSGF